MVQGVEHLAPELEFHRFEREVEVLVDAQIQLVQRQGADNVASGIAEGVAGVGRELHARDVEVVVHRADTIGGEDRAGYVRTERFATLPFRQVADGLELRGNRAAPCAEGDRRGGKRIVDRAQLPATKDLVEHRRHVGTELAPFANRNLHHHTQHIHKLLVVCRSRLLGRQVAHVLHAGLVAVHAVQCLGAVVHRLGPSERVQEQDAVREVPLHLYLKGVVAGEPSRVEPADRAECLVGTAGLQRQVGGWRRLRIRLVVVRHQRQRNGVVADVAEIHQQVPRQFALHREEPALHVGRRQVLGNVEHVGRSRVEVGRAGEADRVALLGGAERRVERVVLVDRRDHNLRSVDAEQVARAHAVLVRVADAVAAANGRLRHHAVGKTDAGSEVLVGRVDQGTVVGAAVFGQYHLVGGRVVVGEHVVALGPGRGVFPADAHVEGELGGEVEIVLDVGEVLVLPVVSDHVGGERVGAAQAEHHVCQRIGRGVGGHGATCCLAQLGTGGLAEAAEVRVEAVERVHVENLHADRNELIANLEVVPSPYLRIVQLVVEDQRVLELGAGGLAAESGEAGDRNREEAAGNQRVTGQAGDAVHGCGVRAAGERGLLAGGGVGETGAGFEDGSRVDGPGVTNGRRLVVDVGKRAVAARRAGEAGVARLVPGVLAETEEAGHAVVDLAVHLDVELVAVGLGERELLEVVGAAGGDRLRQVVEDFLGERGDGCLRNRRVGGIDDAGLRVDDGDGQDASAVVERGQGREGPAALEVAEAFIVAEEEDAVLDHRAADVAAELVLLERGLQECGRAGSEGVADGVEIGVPKEVVRRAVQLVGARAHGDVDGGTAAAAVFSAVVVGDDLELGDGIRGGLRHLVRETLVAGAVGVVVHAVQQVVVVGAAEAVHIEGPFARGGGRRLVDAGGQQREVRIGPAVER